MQLGDASKNLNTLRDPTNPLAWSSQTVTHLA